MAEELIHDRATIRACDEDDVERVTRRIAAARNAGSLPALVEVVLSEVKAATHPEGQDDEIARRLEWATGRNGHTMLRLIRGEGLGVVITAPEEDP